MTCENRLSRVAPQVGRDPSPAQKPAQKLALSCLSRGVASGRSARQRPPEMGQRPPTSPLLGDRSKRLLVPWSHMETPADARTPATTAADTLLLTLDEAARELRCARRSLERQIARHRLEVVHVGRCVRVERRELERFIAQQRNPRGYA